MDSPQAARASALKLYPVAIECRDGAELVFRVKAFDVSAEVELVQNIFDGPSWAECSARVADAIAMLEAPGT